LNMSVELSPLAAHGAAARVALAKMDMFVGNAKTDEEYRTAVVKMVTEGLVPNDMVGALLMGVEHAADILRNEMRLTSKED